MSSEARDSSPGMLNGADRDGSAAKNGRGGELARDEIFDVLSNERRRHALRYLKRLDDRPIELGELVDYITARENDTTVEEIDYKQRKRVYSSLRQTHLPKLRDCGLIEYDRDRGTIELNGAAEEVQMHLEYVPADDIPWCYHYLGLAAVSGALVALAWTGVYPFGGLSGLALAGIVVVSFGLSAVVHTVYTKRNELGAASEPEVGSER